MLYLGLALGVVTEAMLFVAALETSDPFDALFSLNSRQNDVLRRLAEVSKRKLRYGQESEESDLIAARNFCAGFGKESHDVAHIGLSPTAFKTYGCNVIEISSRLCDFARRRGFETTSMSSLDMKAREKNEPLTLVRPCDPVLQRLQIVCAFPKSSLCSPGGS